MKRLPASLLVLEVVVCFLPMVLMLLLGVLVLPSQIYATVVYGEWSGLLADALFLTAGVTGLAALIRVVRHLVRPTAPDAPRYVAVFVMLGLIAVYDVASSTAHPIWNIIGGMALLCSIHLIVLARGYLFGRWMRTNRRANNRMERTRDA